jgi:hypothetical protein
VGSEGSCIVGIRCTQQSERASTSAPRASNAAIVGLSPFREAIRSSCTARGRRSNTKPQRPHPLFKYPMHCSSLLITATSRSIHGRLTSVIADSLCIPFAAARYSQNPLLLLVQSRFRFHPHCHSISIPVSLPGAHSEYSQYAANTMGNVARGGAAGGRGERRRREDEEEQKEDEP